MTKHSFTPEQITKICDTVAAGKTPKDQAKRREKLAEKHKVTPETIIAITAHITMRRTKAADGVGELLRGRNLRIKRAQEALDVAHDDGLPGARGLQKKVDVRADTHMKEQYARALLVNGDFHGAIHAFAEVKDTQSLEEIAAAYASSRPDLAALALQAAGSVDGILELAALQLRAGNRKLYRKLFSLAQE